MVESSQFLIFVCQLKYSAKPLTCAHIMNSSATIFLPVGSFSWWREIVRSKAGKMWPWSWLSRSPAPLLNASRGGGTACWEHEGLLSPATLGMLARRPREHASSAWAFCQRYQGLLPPGSGWLRSGLLRWESPVDLAERVVKTLLIKYWKKSLERLNIDRLCWKVR